MNFCSIKVLNLRNIKWQYSQKPEFNRTCEIVNCKSSFKHENVPGIPRILTYLTDHSRFSLIYRPLGMLNFSWVSTPDIKLFSYVN